MHFATSVGAFRGVMVVVATEATFLALARISVVIHDGVHLHGGTATQSRAIQSVAAARAVVVPDALVEVAPKIGVSGPLLVIVSMWHQSLPW